MIQKIGVIGAGTMGSGIAFAAARSGFDTVLFDINARVMENAIRQIENNLDVLVGKNKIDAGEKDRVFSRIHFTGELHDCVADLVIEAIVEKTDVKQSVFLQLAEINQPSTILASNTSSLSITAIQKNIPHPERIAGMHFFNPAHIMKLVELVKGEATSAAVTDELLYVCKRMNKTGVVCNDAPGFIVNRVARHFYLEALHLAENNNASFEDIDTLMEAAGFKMGPFRLMDLIGMDINLAVSASLYEAFDGAVRFQPSALQIEKVAQQQLGKKTGKGFYDYTTAP